ncbi:hypothetical protein [Streptomyces sp. ST2-7A]|uniref:DUF6895 family protein n=1 Tax=Streptomyces sp. ST2-7A TaxID=2907214 RepID=UPI001F2336AC|nr:hypothetical protein [Streptomyces sp. ST2-7A]MCE7080734.1 hypothetical protein [Streptomyces sp. ST2-7A]
MIDTPHPEPRPEPHPASRTTGALAPDPADTALIHRVGDRAVAWLHRHRDGFRPRPDPDTPDPEVRDRLKPIGELALIGKVLFREGVAGSRQAARARQLLDQAWREHLDGGRLLAWMQREEPLSPIPFEIYVPFRELGYSSPEVEEYARLTQRMKSWSALEALPVRRLGLAAFERRFGLPPSVDAREAVGATWLGHLPEPWTVELNIGYGITHTVFHLTDWGENPDALPPDIAEYLARWLPVWTDDWLEIGHWDLLGELLVVDACLPRPALEDRIWRAFAAAQAPDGAMPARGPLPEGDPREIFDEVYHPTLVAAFASVLATSRAMGAPVGEPV